MRRRGRPVLGGIAGFFLGLFLWFDLVLFGVIPFESVTFYVFPVLGIALGVGLAMWAPFGARSPAPAAASSPAESAPPPARPADTDVPPPPSPTAS